MHAAPHCSPNWEWFIKCSFPRKELACRGRSHRRLRGSAPGWERFAWRRKRQPTAVFLPRRFRGRRSQVGYGLDSQSPGESGPARCSQGSRGPPSGWNPPGRSPGSVPESCLATFSAHLCAGEFSSSLRQETAFKAPPRQVVAPAIQEPQETRVPSLGRGDPLETGMATPPILAWRISMDRGAWRAAVRGVAKSRTPLTERARTPCLFEAFPVSSAPLTPERGGRTQPSFAGSHPRKVLPRRRPGFQTTRVNQTLDAPGKADDARRRCTRGPGLDPNARQLCVRPSLA